MEIATSAYHHKANDLIRRESEKKISKFISYAFVCLIDLMLYVHSKQLRSCCNGQLLNHTFPGQAPTEAVHQYQVPILSPVTDNLLFLNQPKREIIFPRKNLPYARINRGTAACEANTPATEPHIKNYVVCKQNLPS